MKKISVIIPVYKVEKYLDECLASVVNQTYRDLEIIVVDDGSPDDCPRMCEEWSKKDDRISVYHKKNGGLSDARNFGLSKATGEYVMFADSDDYLAPGAAEKMLNTIERDRTDMVICNYAEEYGSKIKAPFFYRLIKDEQIVTSCQAIEQLLECRLSVHVWRRLYKREMLPADLFPKGRNYEDAAVMWKIMMRCDRISLITDCLYFYRQNPGSIMKNNTVKNVTDCLDAVLTLHDGVAAVYPELSSSLDTYLATTLLFTWGLFFDGCRKNPDRGWDGLRARLLGQTKTVRLKNIKDITIRMGMLTLRISPDLYGFWYRLFLNIFVGKV